MYEIVTNFPLITALLAIFFAQGLKIPWNYIINKKWDYRWIFNSGGMPSAHTSSIVSLATAVGLEEGFHSPIFAISAIISIIVMYDALGVRRHAGMQAQVLNRLMEEFSSLLTELKRNLSNKEKTQSIIKLKEILGHKPIEVFAGAVFGILFAITLYAIWY